MLSLLLYAVGMAAQQPDWGYNPNAYPDEHVIYVGLVDDQGSAVQSFNDNTYLGAFIDGECRGLAKVSRYSVSDTQTIYYFALRVKGTNTDNGKAITYRLSVGGNQSFVFNDLKPAANAVTYTNNGTTGKLSALYQLTFIRPGYYSIVQPEVSVKVGAEFNLLDHITFEPANANIPEMNWTMGQGEKENEYASIKGNTFKALKSTGKYGSVSVSPNLWDMKPTGQYTKVSVRVIQPATSIELRDEYKNGITVNLGDTAALNTVLRSGYNIAPADCNEELTWKSSDETAIRPMTSESDLGKFEPVKAGTYTMTLSGENASVDLKVTVIKQVEYIEMVGSVKTIKMFLGENLLDILPAGYKVMPEDATDRSVHYEVNQSNYWGMHEDGDGAYKYIDIFGDLYFNEGDEMIALKPGRVRVTINSTQNPRAYCEYEVIVKEVLRTSRSSRRR